MKKVLLACAAIALLSLCSCNKYKDCQCTLTSAMGVTSTMPLLTAADLKEMGQTCEEWEEAQPIVASSVECVEL